MKSVNDAVLVECLSCFHQQWQYVPFDVRHPGQTDNCRRCGGQFGKYVQPYQTSPGLFY